MNVSTKLQQYKTFIWCEAELFTSPCLAGCWIANEGAGNILFDLAFEENNGDFINGPSWAAGEHGWEVKLDGSNDYVKMPQTDFGINGQLSIVMWFKIDVNNRYRHWLFGHQSAVNGAFDLTLWDENSGKPNKVVGQFYKSDAWRQVYGQTVITVGVLLHCSIFTYDGSVLKLELDGKPDGISNYTGSIPPFYFRSSIGANVNGSFPADGNIIAVYIYNRALSEHECRMHYFNPYAMFEMPKPVIFGGMPKTLLDFERGAGRGITPGVMRGVF